MTKLIDRRVQIEGLRASAPQSLPFAPSLSVRAFTLVREAGNVVVYSVDGLASDPGITGDGEVSRQYLNHRHEAMFAADPLEAPLLRARARARLGGRGASRSRRLHQALHARRRFRGDSHPGPYEWRDVVPVG